MRANSTQVLFCTECIPSDVCGPVLHNLQKWFRVLEKPTWGISLLQSKLIDSISSSSQFITHEKCSRGISENLLCLWQWKESRVERQRDVVHSIRRTQIHHWFLFAEDGITLRIDWVDYNITNKMNQHRNLLLLFKSSWQLSWSLVEPILKQMNSPNCRQ